MRLRSDQLDGVLKKGLMPVYLITGDEPLQLGEVADAIRKKAREQGFDNREVVSVETGFEWNQLAFISDSFSIFGDKKIIDLIYIDEDLIDLDEVWAAAGTPNSVFCIQSKDLLKATDGKVINIKGTK